MSTKEDGMIARGVFFYTKILNSELMVKCLHQMLNNFPKFEFISINRDEKFLGYRVHFSSPGEEEVLEKQLTVSGENIQVCPLKTCLTVHNINPAKEFLLPNEIEDAIVSRFGKVLQISNLPKAPTYREECVQSYRIFSDIPEIKAQEMFQDAESDNILLTLPNRKSKLRVTLCCTLCKKDGHVSRGCNQAKVAFRKKEPSDGERVFADSTMKMDFSSFEPTETYAEKLGREEIMKKGYFSVDEMLEEKCTPEKKHIKKEAESHSSAGVSGENPTTESNNNNTNYYLNSDDDEEIQMLSHSIYPSGQNEDPSSFQPKTEAPSTDEESNQLPEVAAPPARRRRSPRPVIAVEDMGVLSESLKECIDNACQNFEILTRDKLQAFFHHVKKKSNVVEVARKYVRDVDRLKDMLQYISRSYFNTTQTGTKEDKRFIKWLDERIEKFDKKVPQKRKRSDPSHGDTPAKK